MAKYNKIGTHSEEINRYEETQEYLLNSLKKYFDAISKYIIGLSEHELFRVGETHWSDIFSKPESMLIEHPIDVSTLKLNILFGLLSSRYNDNNANIIREYLKYSQYEWNDKGYPLKNNCIRNCSYNNHQHCKRLYKLTNDEQGSEKFGDLVKLFYSSDFGRTIHFIFAYCLTALFTSRLKQDHLSFPFFLQIACNEGSVVQQIIKEIVSICDPNLGLLEDCTRLKEGETFCGYSLHSYYPSKSAQHDVSFLLDNHDVTVIVSGYENEHYYRALLRRVSNMPGSKRELGVKAFFNFLPIFLCQNIISSFDNVLNIDLTDAEIENDYLYLIRRNRQFISSLVLELVLDSNNYLPINKETTINLYGEEIKHPLSRSLEVYRQAINQKYSELSTDNSQSICILNFFFKGFLCVLEKSCRFPLSPVLKYHSGNGTKELNQHEAIEYLISQSENKLVQFLNKYRFTAISSEFNNKPATKLAQNIEKEYRNLKVKIRVLPLEMKKDRYIFSIETLENTKDIDIVKNANTVQRRLKRFEYFRPDLSDSTSIKLVVSEHQSTENNLIDMLQSPEFNDKKWVIPYAIGYDDLNSMCIEDITSFPHILLGGATQSGKSTALMSLLMSIAYKHQTGNVNVLLLDLLGKKESDFNLFNDYPFMSAPVITDLDTARQAILSLVEEHARRLDSDNLKELPYIVCIIDEFPGLYSDISDKHQTNQVEKAITELLGKGRHSKIHLILAAQDPVKKDMRGSIANISVRIAFRCAHYQNSITILGQQGAEKIIGKGQMIFQSPSNNYLHLQGSYMSTQEMAGLLTSLRNTYRNMNKYKYEYNPLRVHSVSNSVDYDTEMDHPVQFMFYDEKLDEAIIWVLNQAWSSGKFLTATSRLQKNLQISFNRADNILNSMQDLGLVQKLDAKKGWKVLPSNHNHLPEDALRYFHNHSNIMLELKIGSTQPSEDKLLDDAIFPNHLQETTPMPCDDEEKVIQEKCDIKAIEEISSDVHTKANRPKSVSTLTRRLSKNKKKMVRLSSTTRFRDIIGSKILSDSSSEKKQKK